MAILSNETKVKWRQRYNRAKEKAGKWLPWLAIGAGTWFFVKGASDGMTAKKEVRKLERWANEEAVPKANRAINRGLETESRVADLERQMNALYEKALNETEGKSA